MRVKSITDAAERDRLFAEERETVQDFNFGPETAAVFDDMLGRSVPYYDEVQRMIGEMVEDLGVDGTNVYDLGCSTCATFRHLAHTTKDLTFIGIDDSGPMLQRAESELKQAGFARRYELRQQDLHKGLYIENASVVILTLTLQFIRPLHRERLLQTIFEGLNHQGCLILVEKVLAKTTLTSRLFIKYYHDFKRRNGYSDIEIAQKREALENVLIPYRIEENEELLRATGFSSVEIFFKWYNFCGILAIK
jgi:tRNA (cmo5U34)-methyltransferase